MLVLVFTAWWLVLCDVRLERNRASARVRRQRKKSMAELYEKEVARLERSVSALCFDSSVGARLYAWLAMT